LEVACRKVVVDGNWMFEKLGMAWETICWRIGTLPCRNVASRFSIIGPARQTRNTISIPRPVQSHYCKLHHCAAQQETKCPLKIFWVVLPIWSFNYSTMHSTFTGNHRTVTQCFTFVVDLSAFVPMHINSTTNAGRSMLIVSLKKSSRSARRSK
jgi:hypothetical protein